MLRRTFIVFAALTLLVAAACGKKPLSDAALEGKSVLSALRDLSASYEAKRTNAFMNRIDGAFKDRAALEQQVEKVFAAYAEIRFTVQPLKMIIASGQKGPIRATFNWDGEWRTTGGRIVRDGGRITFDITPQTYRLMAIDGRNPFLPQNGPSK